VNAVVKRDGAGRPLVIRITVFDAADRRRYEQELVRSRREAERAVGRLRALQRVTAELARCTTVDGVAAVLAGTADAVGAAHTAVHVAGHAAGDGAPVPVAPGGPTGPVPIPAGLYRDAVAAGEPVIVSVEDGARYPDVARALAEAGLRTLVVSPFEAGGRAGLVAFAFGSDARPEEDLPVLRVLTDLASQAAERARLHEEIVEGGRQAVLLARLSREMDEVSGFVGRARRGVEFLVGTVAAWARLDAAARVGDRTGGPGAPVAVAGAEPAGPATTLIELPLAVRGVIFGVLVLAPPEDRPFRPADRPFLVEVAARVALALDNARRYEQERDSALILQRSLLAGDLPADPRVELVTRYRPAVEYLEVGGDWYDAFRLGDDRLGVVVGDVVGRGIRAASVMGQLRSAVRAVAGGDAGPARVLEQLDLFVERLPEGRLATLAYVEVEPANGRLVYACAGHPPPIVVEPGVEPRALWAGRSLPIGLSDAAGQRGQAEAVLPPGSRLLLYSDGLVERRGERIDVGLDRLTGALAALAGVPLPTMVDGVLEALLGEGPWHDDVCVLGLSI
jgi:serine/threonine-protein kinase RsbW